MAAPPRPLSGTDPSGLVNTTKSPRLITKPKEARVSTALLLCHKLGREGGSTAGMWPLRFFDCRGSAEQKLPKKARSTNHICSLAAGS